MKRDNACIIWLTGLPGAGKSTIADALGARLRSLGLPCCMLDGDSVRQDLSKNLGFSQEDRRENIRRVAKFAECFVREGIIAIASLVSPSRGDRRMARSIFGPEQFVEVYVSCPLEECERRDPKGMYRLARAGKIEQFTGVSAPYEEPEDPEVVVKTDKFSVDTCVQQILDFLPEVDINFSPIP